MELINLLYTLVLLAVFSSQAYAVLVCDGNGNCFEYEPLPMKPAPPLEPLGISNPDLPPNADSVWNNRSGHIMGATTYFLSHLKQGNLKGTYEQFISVVNKFIGSLHQEAKTNANLKFKLINLHQRLNNLVKLLKKRKGRRRNAQVSTLAIRQVTDSLSRLKKKIAQQPSDISHPARTM